MNGTPSTASDGQNDLEIVKKLEDERSRLQRQVRIIQADRRHRILGVHPLFRTQDHLLSTFKKEYINLLKDLKIAKSGANKKNDYKMKNEMKKALLQRMKSEIECEEGCIMMKQLENLLRRNNKEMLSYRKLANTTQGKLEERRCQSEQRLVSTENKLEAAKLRFNQVQYENKKIRMEIEHMLKDRAIFNQSWNNMMRTLSKGKKFLTDLFEASTLAYDQRDDWCTKLKSIQEKGKMDQMLQVQEMRDLQKAYDNEMKIYNFLAKKGVMRINKKQEKLVEEQMIKEVEDTKRQFDIHVKILNEITDYTKEETFDKIIEDFNAREHENLSVYKLLIAYCAENEVLSRDVKRIQRDTHDRRDWNEMKEMQRKEKLERLRKRVEEQTDRTEKMRIKLEERNQLIHETMEKVKEIFKLLECSLEPFKNLLGDKEPSLHNLNLTLQLITEKIKDYIQCIYYNERIIQKKRDKSSTSRLKKYTIHVEPRDKFVPTPINLLVPADTCPACVETRWMSRVTDMAEVAFDKEMSLKALSELAADPAYLRSDRIHTLTECRVPASRVILARRYLQQ